MDSSRLYLFTLLSAALFFHTNCQETELETRSLDKEDTLNEKQLIEALQEVLEKLKSKRMPYYEKKYGQLPMEDEPVCVVWLAVRRWGAVCFEERCPDREAV
ncbi:Cocaine- and amphetamine-regulated transcript protein [Acipenser ruthenus]|uniref:Cocaine-and amphetamine-regulated transcript protein n=1 Tax=Acipenser ruthenus TaxID=7906 RepID=A0A444U6E2_ACIRT|nr:Cocaine- and amphetamine-regulated transcript protein [Acipenser ruthenus]